MQDQLINIYLYKKSLKNLKGQAERISYQYCATHKVP